MAIVFDPEAPPKLTVQPGTIGDRLPGGMHIYEAKRRGLIEPADKLRPPVKTDPSAALAALADEMLRPDREKDEAAGRPAWRPRVIPGGKK